jgi:hypothetical protein
MAERKPRPPVFRQPFGSKKCWAYAMASWLKVTPDRNPTSPEGIVNACSNFIEPVSGGLPPKHFHRLLESPFIRMGWKIMDGKDLELAEIRDLLLLGYVYVISDQKSQTTHPPAHARVIYATSPPSVERPAVGIIDPILGDTSWPTNAIVHDRLILGFAQELLSPDPEEGKGSADTVSRLPWFVNNGKTIVNRWTPRPPPGTVIDGQRIGAVSPGIVGQWRIQVDKWTWIYQFSGSAASGSVRSTDPNNGLTSFGKYQLAGNRIKISWDESTWRDEWDPLNPGNQTGKSFMDGETYPLKAVKTRD